MVSIRHNNGHIFRSVFRYIRGHSTNRRVTQAEVYFLQLLHGQRQHLEEPWSVGAAMAGKEDGAHAIARQHTITAHAADS